MAWLLGICLGVVVLMGWALCLASSQADDQIDDWLAEADGTELDLLAISSSASRQDPSGREAVCDSLPSVWRDLARDSARRRAEVHALHKANGERPRARRPVW